MTISFRKLLPGLLALSAATCVDPAIAERGVEGAGPQVEAPAEPVTKGPPPIKLDL